MSKNIINKFLIPKSEKSEVFVMDEVSEIEEPWVINKGIFTIRVTNADDPELFTVNEQNTISGYVHADGEAKVLDLTTSKPKIFFKFSGSYYHFLMDDVSNIIRAIEDYPDHELILDMSGVIPMTQTPREGLTFFYEFLALLKTYEIKHKVVNLIDYDVVYIDDFYRIDYKFTSSLRAEKVYEYFLPYVKDPQEAPTRNVYVSRRRQDELRPHATEVEKTEFFYDGLRIDNEYALESYLFDLGFDIVYPEDFEGFDQQVNFFHSVKTIVSLTSSGLTNAVFMQPGGTVIEVASPIIARPTENGNKVGTLQKSIHNFYKDLSFLKNHTHISIQNPNYSVDDVVNTIESNVGLKDFLRAKVQ